mgnify:CR=1 FL=1
MDSFKAQKLLSNKKSKCEKCGGTGFIINPDNTVEHCECVLSSKQSLLRIMNIPRRYWHIANGVYNFDAYKEDESYTNAYVTILNYVNNFKHHRGRGLIFMGPPGVGKTFFSIFTLIYLEEKYKVRGLFYDVRTLILDLKSLIGKERYAVYDDLMESSYEKLLNRVLEAPILVLDDLGSEILTDYNKDLLTYIIAYRYNEMLPVIITTNFDLRKYDITPENTGLSNKKKNQQIKTGKTIFENDQKNLEEQKGKVFSYDELPNALKADLRLRLGESIASRLSEMCDFIYMFGEDKRIKKRKSS